MMEFHEKFQEMLTASASLHAHLCPRQVLGVRMGILAGKLLGFDLPQTKKELLTIVETDGCFTTGVSVATNCWVGRRTMRVEDYGKVAATFIDTRNGAAIRISPRLDSRKVAKKYAPDERTGWHKQLLGYQIAPDELIFSWQSVTLKESLEDIISQPGKRAICMRCGEEIMNEREVGEAGEVLCRACAGAAYYDIADLQPYLVDKLSVGR
jgi:formylmethanofuran dehydrogenase subunit E